MTSDTQAGRRSTYRHGDLRAALTAAGLALARTGGPSAVVLRAVTREVGVAPNAAYRHFADRDALLQAVSDAALAELADTISAEIHAALPHAGDAAGRARARLRAVGTAYLRFAQDQPALFRTAFSVPDDLDAATRGAAGGEHGLSLFEHLTAALDDLVAAGALPPARRVGAEFMAWSAVHGLAILLIDGPLRALQRDEADAAAQRVIDLVERGL